LGMAGAFSAVADDGNAIFWNPAGLPHVRHQEVNSMYANLFGIGLKDGHLCYVMPITDDHAVGVDWYHSSFDDGELGFVEDHFRLAYGYHFTKRLSLGMNFKYVNRGMSLDGSSVDNFGGFGLDLGILFRMTKNLKLGLMVYDVLDTWVKHDTGRRERIFARKARFGASYRPMENLAVAVDLDDRAHIGAEYWLHDLFAARCGLMKDLSAGKGISYTAGWSLKYKLLQFDYAYHASTSLPATHRFSVSLSFEFVPQLVEVEEIRLEPIFASLYRRYSAHDVGWVVLRNEHKEPLEVSVSVFVPKYMDAPTEVARELLPAPIGDEPAYRQAFGLRPVFSDKMLSLTKNVQSQVEVTVTYRHQKRTRQVKGSAKAAIYRMGMLPLGEDVSPMAALIDPEDEAVRRFARGVVGRYMDRADMEVISGNISKAIQLFDALGSYGVRYVPDPHNPYSEISSRRKTIDSVKYPRETLDPGDRTGDCDDLSVLYSALLENVGIHTVLVDVPGHVYVMFDTGVHKNSYERMCLPEDMYVVMEETIWLPVEVTLCGGSFVRAWFEGLSEYRRWQEKGRLELVDVHRAWKEYEPAHPPSYVSEISVPASEGMDRRVLEDVRKIRRLREDFLRTLERRVNDP